MVASELIGCFALEDFDKSLFSFVQKYDRSAASSGPASPTDAVHIRFSIVGRIKVDHVADSFNIESSGRDVGGNKNIKLPFGQPSNQLLSLVLGQVTVNGSGSYPQLTDLLSHALGLNFRSNKDQHGVIGLVRQQSS